VRLPPIPIDGELARRLSTLHSDTQLDYQPRGLDCLSEEIPAFTNLETYQPCLPFLSVPKCPFLFLPIPPFRANLNLCPAYNFVLV